MISRINEIISSSGYQLVLYKKDYKHFGNCIIKFVYSGKTNIEIITDRHEIIFDNKTYQMSSLGDVTKADKVTLILKFLEIIFNIVKSNDWRLTGQESYLLFAKLKEMIPLEYINSLDSPKMFHKHCRFCWDKVEENKDKKHYCTLDNYHWICNECYNEFEKMFKFTTKE